VLAVHGPDDVRRAVATEDLGALTQVPGIGRKGAQRIVIELKDRLGPPRGGGSSASTVPAPRGSTSRDQVLEALQGLGWAPRDAEEAVSAVTAAGAAPADDVAAMLRAALRTLSRS
jgi:Holliday junction DNA helicase RuvA